jgi:osmotically-inducible protein OsmY
MSRTQKESRRGVRWLVAAAAALLMLAPAVPLARAAERPKDATIDYWVLNALREDPRVPAEGIHVATDGGMVKLTGTVRTLASRKYAEREALKISGVRGVIDEIAVDTPPRFEFDIMQDILERLLDSSSIDSRDLDVEVHDGHVVLKGRVGSWAEVEQAGLLATETTGVQSVENLLTVDIGEKRSDDDVQKDVRAALDRDIYLTGLPINVMVTNGRVELSGEVGTAYEKERAEDGARWVRGVRGVDSTLEVHWWDRDGTRKDAPAPAADEVRRSVIDDLAEDPRVDSTGIGVKVEGGHVTLFGVVPTLTEKTTAEADARDVVGTAWVTNLLGVDDVRRSDEAIKADLLFEMDADSALSEAPITVEVRDGTAVLAGRVDKLWEKFHAQEVASRVRGVRAVIDNLAVSEPAVYSDASIRRRLMDRLDANGATRWAADEIHVAVDDGKVTLTGTVDFWSEYTDACRVAFSVDGVRTVDNQIHVRGYDYPWVDFAWPASPGVGTVHSAPGFDRDRG